ncbi:glycosyltransferase involved in cell wall biosynthesis [Spirosoma lacussanchae]|uniref:glycosyltransferase family 2 protein n=1 Tax=Spirosoma lacussanchae TaxID=1884249 RepID=UPI00110994DD|nr:glycosyltransferase family 2 protein [Spirosoma lacussanchae]
MNDYNPLISIIIAVYNGGAYLKDALDSIIQQEYKNLEILVIDGGSTDNTLEIINSYKKFIKYTISERDNGIYDAWNKGIRAASGEWIAFIGADDILYPHAYQAYVSHIANLDVKNTLEFVSSRIDLVDNDLNKIETVGLPWNWYDFKKKMITWHVGTLHSKALFAKYGLFNPNYKISGDYELLLRPKRDLIASYVPVVTVMMRSGGVSNTLFYKAIDETYRAKIQNGIFNPYLGTLLKYNNKVKLFVKLFLIRIGFVKKL